MSDARPVVSPPAIVLGGGIAGLGAARLLGRHYPEVLVLERDVRDEVHHVEDAFRSWERGGVPQFRHSHAFLARVRLTLLAHMPEVLDRLRLAGVREIGLHESTPPGMTLRPRPDDEDVVLLACRRATFEWALRESVRTRPGVELREGVHAAGFTTTRGPGERPWISGVRLDDGTELAASIVVDALGRRSPTPAWLAAAGITTPRERTFETGIFYYTRFYRVRRYDLAPQGTTGLVAGDFGWVKIAVFPGDHDTFSITIGPPVEDQSLKRLAEPEQFERFVSAFPQIAPWRAPGVSEPIHGPETPVLVMGQLRNRLRHFVDAGGPVAPGLFVIGDAAYHTNPIYGRGCPTALAQAALLDESIARHRADPIAAARHLHDASERELRPFWDAAVASDRRMRGHGPLDLTNPRAVLAAIAMQAFGWFIDHGILPATRADPVVFRGLLRVFHMLDAPEKLTADPTLVLRALPVLARVLGGMPPPQVHKPVRREDALARLAG
jgi:2-polyprenyl-6-methoxyphenol hydroxylase-like FAD-dependent oxidoreductase